MGEFKKFVSLTQRNTACYFKDKFTFFISLITPLILLILFVTFLRNVYMDVLNSHLGELECSWRIKEGFTGAWLMSSILPVGAVTVAFSSNVIMIQDRIHGCLNDFSVSPVKKTTLTLAYFVSNFFVTLLVMSVIMVIGYVYLAIVGWYIPVGDVFLIIVDLIINVLFGTLFAAFVGGFIKSEGAMSGVATLVSSMYGFICGAYMPLSQFSEGLSSTLCLLPGTYGVSILRNHYLGGYLSAFEDAGLKGEYLEMLKKSFDAEITVFGNSVPLGAMYGIILGACALLFVANVVAAIVRNKKFKTKKSK